VSSRQQLGGLRIVEHGETAGLGDRIAEDSFLEQFVGMDFRPKIEMSRTRSQTNQYDAIAGATISSRAVGTIINQALLTWYNLEKLQTKPGDAQ
jgi:electron transport complex protein RnfG